jgi:hypothetical protein
MIISEQISSQKLINTMKININILKEHPLNQEIYGDDEKQLNELVEKIMVSNWIKPILISKDYVIISGHQRVRAAKVLGYTEIDYEFMVGDEDKQLELLLNENAFREKTTLQKTKEGELYHELESRKALERQKAGIDLGVLETQGRTNEIVAGKIGMSESAYKKSRKVSQKIDETEDPALKWFLGESLNENITLTANLVDKPIEFVTEIIERLDGDIKDVSKVFRQMEQEELAKSVHLPSGKYQVIYVESGKQPIDQYSQLPIGGKGSDDCVLFFWTTPVNLETSIKLINSWGFHYKTAFLWNKDVMNEVSDYGEILLIATKGRPPLIKQTAGYGLIEKPLMVREMIDQTYSGSKIMITLGEGWHQW